MEIVFRLFNQLFNVFNQDELPTVEPPGTYPDSELRNLKSQYNALDSTKTHFVGGIVTESDDLKKVETQLESLSPDHLSHHLDNLQLAIVSLNQTVQVLIKETHDAEERLDRLVHEKVKAASQMNETQTLIDHLKQMKQALNQSITHKKEYVDEAFKTHDELEKKIEELEKQFALVQDIQLLNDWQESGKRYSAPGYRMSHDGFVFLTGVVSNGYVAYGRGNIFELAEQYTPRSWPVILALVENDAGRVDVHENGMVTAVTPSYGSWFSLDGINFPSKSCNLTFLDIQEESIKSLWRKSELHPQMGYALGRAGVVHLTGTIRVKEGRSVEVDRYHGALVATLPKEAFPRNWIAVPALSMNSLARIDIESDGSILVVFPMQQSDWYSFDGISFVTASAKVNDIELKNNWQPYNSKHPNPGYVRTDDGVIYLTGIVKNGLVKYRDGVIFTLPEGSRPERWMVFRALGDNDVFRIDIRENGDVIATAPTGSQTSWISLDGITFFAK